MWKLQVVCTKQNSWHQCFKWKWNAPSFICWLARWVTCTSIILHFHSFPPKAEITQLSSLLDTLLYSFFFFFFTFWGSKWGHLLHTSNLGSFVLSSKKKNIKFYFQLNPLFCTWFYLTFLSEWAPCQDFCVQVQQSLWWTAVRNIEGMEGNNCGRSERRRVERRHDGTRY